VARGVANILRDCLRDTDFEQQAEELIEPLEEAWSAWVSFADGLRTEPYEYGGFDLRCALDDDDAELKDFRTPAAATGVRTERKDYGQYEAP
jgi:hypothetical protein